MVLLLEEQRETLVTAMDIVKSVINVKTKKGLTVSQALEQVLVLMQTAVDQESDAIQTEVQKKEADQKKELLQLLQQKSITELKRMLQQLDQKSAAPAADPPVSSTAASGDAPTAGPTVGRFFKKQAGTEVHDKKKKNEKTENKDPNAGTVQKRGRPAKQVKVPAQKKKKADSGSDTETEEADARMEKGLIRPQTPGRKMDEDDEYEWF